MVPLQLASSNLALGVDLRLTGKPPPGRLLNFRKLPFVALVELFWENCWRVGENTWWVRATGLSQALPGREASQGVPEAAVSHSPQEQGEESALSWGWKLLASECGTHLALWQKKAFTGPSSSVTEQVRQQDSGLRNLTRNRILQFLNVLCQFWQFVFFKEFLHFV